MQNELVPDFVLSSDVANNVEASSVKTVQLWQLFHFLSITTVQLGQLFRFLSYYMYVDHVLEM